MSLHSFRLNFSAYFHLHLICPFVCISIFTRVLLHLLVPLALAIGNTEIPIRTSPLHIGL